jgi:hypothetical protein
MGVEGKEREQAVQILGLLRTTSWGLAGKKDKKERKKRACLA